MPANPPPAWRSYIPSLDALMPGKGDEERRLRCGMMLLRDRAIRARQEAGWEADMVLGAVQNIASENALAPMALEDIRHLHYNLLRLVATASNLQTIASRKAQDANG